jgi:Mg2+-importing ATPase
MKYVFMATSANFGNMFSMAAASTFLSFLPLFPKQILLMNLLTDFPEMTIASDNVDEEIIQKPVKWDIKFIRSFMIVFGLISSIFDFITFGVLILFLHASIPEFRTGWFIESIVSAAFIVLVVRTRKPFFKSRPSIYLSSTVILVCLFTFLIPYFTPLASLFEFTPLSFVFSSIVIGIVITYVISVEIAKKIFYRRSVTLIERGP